MTSAYKDHLGRPLIAVTGMGVITSLGQGVEDNWKALTSGVSGIHKITRFPTEGLSTRISGTVDFIDLPAENAVERSYAFARETTAEALAQAGHFRRFQRPSVLGSTADRAGMERPFRARRPFAAIAEAGRRL